MAIDLIKTRNRSATKVALDLPGVKTFCGLAIIFSLFSLSSCRTTSVYTKQNYQNSDIVLTYFNTKLNISIQLNGDYILNLNPINRPDSLTRKQLRTLGLRKRNVDVLFTAKTSLDPAYSIRALLITSPADWVNKGFTKMAENRYQKSSFINNVFLLEYAFYESVHHRWIYLIANDNKKSNSKVDVRKRKSDLDDEFTTFTFPSLRFKSSSTSVNPFVLAQNAFFSRKNGDYLAPLVVLDEYIKRINNSDTIVDGSTKFLFWQAQLQYYAQAGNTDIVKKLMQEDPLNVERASEKQFTSFEDSNEIDSQQDKDTLVSVDAIAEILTRAKNVNAVLLNESHWQNEHRVLATQLLPGLYNQGYRYLALEALSDTLPYANTPLTLSNGFYTREPTFANMIRLARKLGYRCISYEALQGQSDRELGQAQNLYRALAHRQDGKVFIYGGGSHMDKHFSPGGSEKKWMAQHLIDLTHWSVLSVNQARHSHLGVLNNLSPVPLGTAQAVYRIRNGRSMPYYSANDIMVRNNLVANSQSVPSLFSSKVVPLGFSFEIQSSSSDYKRRIFQLYLKDEFDNFESVPPVYVHELKPLEKKVLLSVCPGTYVYRLITSGETAEIIQEVVVR